MGFFSKKPSVGAKEPEMPFPPHDNENQMSYEVKDPAYAQNTTVHALGSDGESIASSTQDGVKAAMATTIVWTRNALILVYALIFLIFFINSLAQQILNNLVFYVTDSFKANHLTIVTGVVSQLLAGIVKLPTAKIMDVFGRPAGFCLMVFLTVVGLIMMAACENVTTYAAAQCFYWVGYDGIAYVLDVFIADTSSLKWRGLMLAFSTSPYIVTTFAGPPAAASFEPYAKQLSGDTSGWRWAYGTFAIVTPFICTPFVAVFWYNQHLAKKQGILEDRRAASGRSFFQSLKHYFIEFDIFGILLLCAGWALFLLPFNLATSQSSKWKSGSIIAMLVVGIVLLIAFVLYEAFLAPKCFLPLHFLRDPTVLGSCLTATIGFISFYGWDAIFTQFVRVVYNLDITNAGYIYNIYSIGSCFFAIIVGLLIPASGRFKWLALCAIPVQILGTGLMIHFRQPHQHIGYVVMCQIFIAFSGGTIVICQQLAIMAAVGPANVASALALQAVFTSVGGAIGLSISGAIWTNKLLGNLETQIAAVSTNTTLAASVYADFSTALTYEMGSPERTAIIEAYGHTQKYMCIAATCVLPLSFIGVLMWKNFHVNDFKKPAGAKII